MDYRRSIRLRFGLTFAIVLLFNLYWYGAFLSFPLMGEDGAANYSFLLENLKNPDAFSTTFPIKWLEGLGQPNAFVTLAFDPFSWIMLLPFDMADTFRISMALRASVCWAATFLFSSALFKGRRDIAFLVASLNMLMSFTLGHSRGVPTIAGIPNATHYAIFPLLLYFIVIVLRHRRWFGWPEAGLLGMLAFFFITFPLSSVIGFTVAFAFAGCAILCARPSTRMTSLKGGGKILILGVALLLLPKIGMWHAWSALVDASARVVFADELYAYGRSYNLPYMWHDVPIALKLCVLLGLAALAYAKPWPRPLRIVVLTLSFIIGGVQLWSFAQVKGAFGGILDRAPRPHYFEFYLPIFYCVSAGFVLRYFRRLIPLHTRWSTTLSWAAGWVALFLFGGALFPDDRKVFLGGFLGVTGALSLIAAIRYLFPAWGSRVAGLRDRGNGAGIAVVGALFVLGVGTWVKAPTEFHPIFAMKCARGVVWCRDKVGPSIGAEATAITDFLQRQLSASEVFLGRADTLLVPSFRFSFTGIHWSPELFDKLKSWYRRAYEARPAHFSHSDYHLAKQPDEIRWEDRERLLFDLQSMAGNGDDYYGTLPEDVVFDMRAWSENEASGNQVISIPSTRLSEVGIMVEERNRAFLRTGNGMMLRALPMHQIPVASSYEQALDFLYYLLWTRYINEGGGSKYIRSINFTSLEIAHAERLALIGIRYVIARKTIFERPPFLTEVMSWKGYAVYEVPSPNVSGYSPVRVVFAKTLADELAAMRDPAFDPRKVAIAPESSRALFVSSRLSSIERSRISLKGNELLFEAKSNGEASFAVLPFRYTACWNPTWDKGAGHVIRADLGLIGVLFSGQIVMRLRWDAGYGEIDCLRDDKKLAYEAQQAAMRFPN